MQTEITASDMPEYSNSFMTASEPPNGARFYRCALQINPYAYLQRHKKATPFNTEKQYNEAIIEACLNVGVEVIAVTDHYRVKDSKTLINAARKENIHAFSGFEAVSKDGVHFLCLFDPDQDDRLESYLGAFGIHSERELSPIGNKDSNELLESARQWGAACIAAHVASSGGLLKKLSGKPRINAWTDPNLHACILPGPVSDAPQQYRSILENKDAQYRRSRPLAILNSADVNHPDDLKENSASCFIKMSAVSIEAFRQSFLDPASRIRLHSDGELEPHAEFLAMNWQGGFLRDTTVHFNANLNVLVGGRGTGKSTMIESIRYVLDLNPLGEEALKAQRGVVQNVLQSGTKVSLLVRSCKPSECRYTIERTVPNPPVVKNESGEVLDLLPHDVMPGVEVYGQHEISELTKNPEKLTLLLDRFVNREPSISERKLNVHLELERSRNRINDTGREIKRLEEKLAALPSLEEAEKRYRKAGIEKLLKDKSLVIREEQIFSSLEERLNQYRRILCELNENLPIDKAFVSDRALEGLPNSDVLAAIRDILSNLDVNLLKLSEQYETVLDEANQTVSEVKSQWEARKAKIENAYEEVLRELQKSKIDGAQFIQIRQQIESLRPLHNKMRSLRRDLNDCNKQRLSLLAEWEDINAMEFRRVEEAAKRVSKLLRDKVKVSVTMSGNRDRLELLLREIGGSLNAALDRLRGQDQLSWRDFVKRCREGKQSLMEHYRLPAGAAERIANADSDLLMRIEELDLPATTQIQLNTAPEGDPANWQTLQELSTGQKATAVLLLLLLESDAPLVVDQPEDDLDNRFVTESIVPIMRREKQRRQLVFSTHNANIPVLGDAELILGFATKNECEKLYGRIAPRHMASIDSAPVRELVEEILEGGKTAFEMRRSKYGF